MIKPFSDLSLPVLPFDMIKAGDFHLKDAYFEKTKLKLGTLKRLKDLEEDFYFFSLALPYIYGRFQDHFFVEYCNTIKEKIDVYYYAFKSQVWDGLTTPDGDADWNFCLFALEKPYWPSFLDYICSLTFIDQTKGNCWRFGFQQFQLRDPLEEDRAILGTTTITAGAFGIYSNRHRLAFYHKQPFRPKAAKYNAKEEDVLYAKWVFDNYKPIYNKEKFIFERDNPGQEYLA